MPPGSATKASARSAIICLRSCIVCTTCSSVRPPWPTSRSISASRNHADHAAARRERGVGHDAHQADPAAAVDQRARRAGRSPRPCSCAASRRRRARRRSASRSRRRSKGHAQAPGQPLPQRGRPDAAAQQQRQHARRRCRCPWRAWTAHASSNETRSTAASMAELSKLDDQHQQHRSRPAARPGPSPGRPRTPPAPARGEPALLPECALARVGRRRPSSEWPAARTMRSRPVRPLKTLLMSAGIPCVDSARRVGGVRHVTSRVPHSGVMPELPLRVQERAARVGQRPGTDDAEHLAGGLQAGQRELPPAPAGTRPSQRGSAQAARAWLTGRPCFVTRRTCQVLIARVWPPRLQNQTK